MFCQTRGGVETTGPAIHCFMLVIVCAMFIFMKLYRALSILTVLLALALLFSSASFGETDKEDKEPACEENEKVKWLAYDEAMKKGDKEDKPILLVFYQDHCRLCEVLDEESFQRADIACYINRKMAASRIHIRKQPELKRKYKVPGSPVVYFLKPSGGPIDYFVGYLKPEKVYSILRYIGERAYEDMSYEEYREGKEG